MPADTDHVALRGILSARSKIDQVDAFLHSIDEFDIKPVHDAFDKARQHCKLLAQDLFDADVALALRAKSGTPTGPLFEQEAAEKHTEGRAELERKLTSDAAADAPEAEKKKRGRPKKRAPEEPPPEVAAVTYQLRRDPGVGGATFACRLEGVALTGLSRPIEPREMPAMTPENLPSLAYDENPQLLGWAAGQLKAIEGKE